MRIDAIFAVAVAGVMIGTATPTVAANRQVSLKTDGWTVYRSVDPMTDAIKCVGIHSAGPGFQLSSNVFFLDVPGGIQSVTLRFDDLKANEMRLPTRSEKAMNSVAIQGEEFKQLINSKRLRYESLTLINGVNRGDIDLTGILPVLDHMKAGCPVDRPSGQ